MPPPPIDPRLLKSSAPQNSERRPLNQMPSTQPPSIRHEISTLTTNMSIPLKTETPKLTTYHLFILYPDPDSEKSPAPSTHFVTKPYFLYFQLSIRLTEPPYQQTNVLPPPIRHTLLTQILILAQCFLKNFLQVFPEFLENFFSIICRIIVFN